MPPERVRLSRAAAPPEPWRSFLQDLDDRLKGSVELRCLGGFVVTQLYGIGRTTSDIAFLAAIAQSPEDNVETVAGVGSDLHCRHRLYVQHVGIVTPPAGYADRLTRMFPSAARKRLTLSALDPIDLALSKLERNAERDREDFLGFRRRYFDELRPYLLNTVTWHDKLSNSGSRWPGHHRRADRA